MKPSMVNIYTSFDTVERNGSSKDKEHIQSYGILQRIDFGSWSSGISMHMDLYQFIIALYIIFPIREDSYQYLRQRFVIFQGRKGLISYSIETMLDINTPFQFAACKGSGYAQVMMGVEDTLIRYYSSENSPQLNDVEVFYQQPLTKIFIQTVCSF